MAFRRIAGCSVGASIIDLTGPGGMIGGRTFGQCPAHNTVSILIDRGEGNSGYSRLWVRDLSLDLGTSSRGGQLRISFDRWQMC